MSMTDPIADMLTRIRNAQVAGHDLVSMPRSNLKVQIARVLAHEGFIEGFVEDAKGPQGTLKVFLKYDGTSRSTIRGIRRVSKPSRRVYVAKDEIPRVRNGLGIAILTTPRGVLTDAQARQAGVGGEVICHVW
jgi:small subunit ribosomal protein S8